jgi:LuxR family transcriptional regulator
MINSSKINDYFVPSILDATDVIELWSNFTKIMSEFRFNRIIYATTKLSKSGLSEDLKDGLVLSNHDPKYIKEMIKNKCFDNDTRWMEVNKSNSVSWAVSDHTINTKIDKDCTTFRYGLLNKLKFSEILFYPPIKTPPSRYEKNIWKLYNEYNVKAGHTLYFKHLFGRGTSGLALCSSPEMDQAETNSYWESNGKNIEFLSKLFDKKIRQLPTTNFSQLPTRKKLTKRQKSVLQWISKGKSISDISTIMELSVPTIDKHLRLARKNLNARTTIQAVIKAQKNKQLYNFNYY